MARGGFRRALEKLGNNLADLIFKSAPKPSPPPVPEPPRKPPPEPPYDHRGEIPYPSGWSTEDKRFWDANIPRSMYRDFDSDEQWREAQQAFDDGWMHPHMSLESVEPYRRRFFRITGMPERVFNWGAFKDWYAATH